MTSTATLGRGALLEASGGVFDYVSASRLNSWLACPLKFKLKYLDRVPTPSTPPLFVGKACHAGLEVFYRHRMLGGFSPSFTNISTPSTTAGSTSGPVGAARCAISGKCIAAGGPAESIDASRRCISNYKNNKETQWKR
jgi:hypothetical protein